MADDQRDVVREKIDAFLRSIQDEIRAAEGEDMEGEYLLDGWVLMSSWLAPIDDEDSDGLSLRLRGPRTSHAVCKGLLHIGLHDIN